MSKEPKSHSLSYPKSSEIVSIDCLPARLPLRKPLVMSTYRIDDGPVLFVRIRTRGGAEGWGEAAANPIMSGETLTGMAAAVKEMMAPRLLGRSVLERARLMRELRSGIYGNGGAMAAVDMALLDTAGHVLGVSAADLLGGAVRDEIMPLWLIGGSGDPEHDVGDALQLHAQGFRAFKLKVGLTSIGTEARTVELLRAALGEDSLIAADANMGWDVGTAIRFATAAAPFGLAFLEQPTASGDVGRLAAVAARAPVPIGADESIHGVGDILAHANARAISGASLKTIKLGGITQVVAAGALCNALGLSVNLAMMMESSLAASAMLHAASVLPRVDWGLSLGHLWLAEDPVEAPIACRDGIVRRPAGPGLGVRVDERRLAALAA
jgi:muconate cycloisomerase